MAPLSILTLAHRLSRTEGMYNHLFMIIFLVQTSPFKNFFVFLPQINHLQLSNTVSTLPIARTHSPYECWCFWFWFGFVHDIPNCICVRVQFRFAAFRFHNISPAECQFKCTNQSSFVLPVKQSAMQLSHCVP